jgi:hypothetical protein
VRTALARDDSGLRGTQLVVREDQVGATALYVDDRAEVFERNGSALDVPTGSTGTERRLPGRVTGAYGLP